MPSTLRDAWTSKVQVGDYEAHMAAIGQAQANAAHVADFLARVGEPGARLLIAGAGTGQMFDYLPPGVFDGYRSFFADINPRFLAALRRRSPGSLCVADDLEHSALKGPFHAAAAVLVLEHIRWRKGLDTLAALNPRYLFLVLQRNPEGMTTAVSPTRVLPASMQNLGGQHPELVDKSKAATHLQRLGYALIEEWPRNVPDSKVMLGLLFERVP
ncbi:MAG: hypothetical protein J0H49_14960 [Acidobacteria bacterium]|nr:hypothetical protein [Acidobacteriota bacterium]